MDTISVKRQTKLIKEYKKLMTELNQNQNSWLDNYYKNRKADIVRGIINNRRDFSIKELPEFSEYCGVADGLLAKGHVIHCDDIPVTLNFLLIQAGYFAISPDEIKNHRESNLSKAQGFYDQMIEGAKLST